jgi:GTP diphosphokinase / guanosine-3',5'-bis(diphosphate) 3'-diphosphatase
MLRITDILDKVSEYTSQEDMEMIEKAYIFSASVHQGQVRLSGEPYLTHPMEVAGMLADMKLDTASIITGLLHDTVEDTLATKQQIENAFGKEVAFLVEGLTKISKITLGSQEERQAENFRKMIMAMSSDIRILMVRLADRLHNMRTLEYQPYDRQRFIAKETMELYAPLANRLGINWMKTELEDLSFQYLYPEEFADLSKRIAGKTAQREKYTQEVKTIIQEEVTRVGLTGIVEGRAKHLYGIYKKMMDQHIDFDEVYDLIAFRIILDSAKERECYEALSIVHALWKPVPGRFKDYIAMPKANNYRSLHTTVIGPYGERVEIQIRTKEMHEWAEEGIAAHWRYKEGELVWGKEEEQIKRLRELLEVQHDDKNPREFMKNIKMALFPDEVYVFTPGGDVKSFPKGATPIDFAYSIHTDVGDRCIGAKVNRNIVPLKYELQNGDTVEIITQAGHHPARDWLKFAVTSKAITKIKNWIKTEEWQKSIELGRDILERELKKSHLKLNQVLKSAEFKALCDELTLSTPEDVMAQIGYGKISAKMIVNRFAPEDEKKNEPILERIKRNLTRPASAGVSITGIEDMMVRFARCCDPVPGDDVVGYISRGRGMSVHLSNCAMLKGTDPERLIEVQWNIKAQQAYPVQLRVICKDKKGLLAEVSNSIAGLDINIVNAKVDTSPDQNAILDFQLEVHDLKQLNQLTSTLKKLRSVISVERMRRT